MKAGPEPSVGPRLRALTEQLVGDTGPGAVLRVNAPLHHLDWVGASGYFARGARRRLRPSDGFRIASMSKTFTAVLVMQLVAQGVLSLDGRVASFFARGFLKRMHPDAARIRVRDLLRHTAGFDDFAMSRAWGRAVRADPGRFRAPAEILAWIGANTQAIGPVGGEHHYSDTGYVLLGHILEQCTGMSYARLCRRRVLAPAGMTETWLEGHEQPRSTLSHTYLGDFDGLQINGSVDWAAGGHVSTVSDLDRFLRALFESSILLSAEGVHALLHTVPSGESRYGLGVRTRRAIDAAGDTHVFWGHSGYWGSWMFYAPALRLTVSGTVNRTGTTVQSLLDTVVNVLAGLDRPQPPAR